MNGKPIDPQAYDEIEHWPHHTKKKNTKRWCKGKVGREHEPVIELNMKYNYGRSDFKCGTAQWGSGHWVCHHHLVCKKCNKELKFSVECPDNVNKIKTLW